MKKYLKLPLYLLASITIGTILILSVYLIPPTHMTDNVLSSSLLLLEEGNYRSLSEYPSSKLDNFTDAFMINIASYHGDEDFIYQAMMNPHIRFEGTEGVGWLAAKTNPTNYPEIEIATYQRYWHGYLIFLKPLLTIFRYQDLRIINGFCQNLLLSFTLILLYKKLGIAYIFSFLVSLFILNPVVISLSFQYSSIYYITLLTSLILLLKNEWFQKKEERPLLLFMFTGIFVGYFDFLTYPIVALGIPLVLYLLLNENTLIKQLSSLFFLSTAFFFGYAGMWSGKWIVCSLLTGDNTIKHAIGAAKYRTRGSSQDAIWANLQSLYNKPTLVICSLVIIICILGLIIYKCKITSNIIPFFFLCLYPFIWYSLAKNHSTMHAFFTYRNLAVLVFSGLCATVKCMNFKKAI